MVLVEFSRFRFNARMGGLTHGFLIPRRSLGLTVFLCDVF